MAAATLPTTIASGTGCRWHNAACNKTTISRENLAIQIFISTSIKEQSFKSLNLTLQIMHAT